MMLWLTAAAFGATSYAVGPSRVGPALLAIGSLLALTGIDRLGLTSSANETIFGPLSQVGIVLHGCGWIFLGGDLAFRRPVRSVARSPLLALLAVVFVACSTQPTPPPARPATPAGWTVTESGSGDLRLALPPDIIAFDTSGAIFANEPPPPSGGDWIEVMAEGPTTVTPQPNAGEPLERWLDRLWFAGEPDRGGTTTKTIQLPAGRTVELRTTLGPGTSHERAVILYAIRTPTGVARLVIDGPPESMRLRATDLSLISTLIELGPRG